MRVFSSNNILYGNDRIATKLGGGILSFPGFSRAISLLFHGLSQQEVNVIMTFIKGDSTSTPVRSILADIYWSLLPEIVMILFTHQSTAVLHKYLNEELTTLFVTIFLWGCIECHVISLLRESHDYSRFVATLKGNKMKTQSYMVRWFLLHFIFVHLQERLWTS